MCLVPVLIALSLTTGADPAAKKQEGQPVWLASLPATLSPGVETASVDVHGCRISIGTAFELGSIPPVNHVWVRKEGCDPGGYVVLGSTFGLPSTLLDASKKAIVATFTTRSTPSGSAFQFAQLVALDFVTGEVTRSFTLAALPPFGTGIVEPSSLELRGNGTVIVRGTKNGVIPGETGAGDEFVATFEKFVRSSELNLTVVAF